MNSLPLDVEGTVIYTYSQQELHQQLSSLIKKFAPSEVWKWLDQKSSLDNDTRNFPSDFVQKPRKQDD